MTQAQERDTRRLLPVADDGIEVVVQVPRGGFIKPRSGGGTDFVSPMPCPFNYGEVPGTAGADGDPWDAVVLGPTLRRGDTVQTRVRGGVSFLDAGRDDLKLICGAGEVSAAGRAMILVWFHGYALAKRALYALRGDWGAARGRATRCIGWDPRLRPPAPEERG